MHSALPHTEASSIEQYPGLIRKTLELIAAKWTVPIFYELHLSPTPLRYAALQRRLGAITPKELAKKLRQLDAAGLVRRQVHTTVPPKVEYSLTEMGKSLYPSLAQLAEWAARVGATMSRNMQADERSAEGSPDAVGSGALAR